MRSGYALCIRDVTLPPEHLKGHGWVPFQVWGVVEWCGHRIEGIPVPGLDGRWRLIPILGGSLVTDR